MTFDIYFQIYYPRSQHSDLIKNCLLHLLKDVRVNWKVESHLVWHDRHKGENLAVYLKGVVGVSREESKAHLSEVLNLYLSEHPGRRENELMDDYLFMDYPVNRIVFDDQYHAFELVRNAQEEEISIARCLKSSLGELSTLSLEVYLEQGNWTMSSRMITMFRMFRDLLLECDRQLITQRIQVIVSQYVAYFNLNPTSPGFNVEVQKSEAYFEKYKDILQTEMAFTEKQSLWIVRTKKLLASDASQSSQSRTLIDAMIHLTLSIGLGPDTGWMVMVWLSLDARSVEVEH